MSEKKTHATRNARTGSYTVRVPKSTSTGKFAAETKPNRSTSRIILGAQPKKKSA